MLHPSPLTLPITLSVNRDYAATLGPMHARMCSSIGNLLPAGIFLQCWPIMVATLTHKAACNQIVQSKVHACVDIVCKICNADVYSVWGVAPICVIVCSMGGTITSGICKVNNVRYSCLFARFTPRSSGNYALLRVIVPSTILTTTPLLMLNLP